MARAGRKPKSGKRSKSGQLKQRGVLDLRCERPSEWVAQQQRKFGVHYCWALGRAYAGGLLGDGTQALDRYQGAKRFVRLYQRFIGGSAYHCPLDDSPRGTNVVRLDVSDKQQADAEWLMDAMRKLDESGTRPWFDQLISVLHVDAGPYWVDALITGGKHPADQAVMRTALAALDLIAPPQMASRILVAA